MEIAWKILRDNIEEMLVPFCALCDGAGMSYRTIRKHPHLDWLKYQLAGLRISSDRGFETSSLSRYGLVTPELHRIDLENFERAADFASEGFVDDDFNAPSGRGHARLIPGFATPQMPNFGGNILKDYLVAGYRTVYNKFKATPPPGFHSGIVRKWISLQLLAILDERNFSNVDVVDAIEINLEFTKRLHAGWAHNFNVSHAPVDVFATPFPTYFWYSNPAFGALRQREDVYMTDAPDTPENSSDIVWVDTVERDRRLDLVDQILGDTNGQELTPMTIKIAVGSYYANIINPLDELLHNAVVSEEPHEFNMKTFAAWKKGALAAVDEEAHPGVKTWLFDDGLRDYIHSLTVSVSPPGTIKATIGSYSQ